MPIGGVMLLHTKLINYKRRRRRECTIDISHQLMRDQEGDKMSLSRKIVIQTLVDWKQGWAYVYAGMGIG